MFVSDESLEEMIKPETAKTTGDNVANPSHTEKLDAVGKSG